MIDNFFILFHGVLASIFSLAFIYALGIFCLPRIIFDRTNYSITPFFCGAALFSLIGWYGIKLNISLSQIFIGLLLVLVVMGMCFFKKIDVHSIRRYIFSKKALVWLSTYIIFYGLMATFIPFPHSLDKLPIVSLGNNDIFSYLDNARYLIHLGPSNIADFSYISEGCYAEIPAVFYFIDLLSFFYHNDVMAVMMPMIYTCMALIGLMILRYCREIFKFSHAPAMAIAAIVISGPFYRYIGIQYFLSSLMGTICFLALLTDTAKFDFSDIRQGFYRLLMMNLPYWILLSFLYSILFFGVMAAQIGLILLIMGYNYFTKVETAKRVFKKLIFWGCSFFCCFIIVILLDPFHGLFLIQLILKYSQVVQHGWGLGWISPFAILGFPGHFELHSFSLQIIWGSIFFGMLSVILIFAFKESVRNRNVFLFLVLTIFSFILYSLYFYHLGDAYYQPWKFASYYALPLAGVIWGALFYLLSSRHPWKHWDKIIIGFGVILVLWNGFFAYYSEQPFEQFSSKYHSLEKLNAMPFQKLWIQMASYSSTFLPFYFLPNKTLYSLGDSYFPKMILDPATISQNWPLFIETEEACKGEGVRIDNLGCLYTQPL